MIALHDDAIDALAWIDPNLPRADWFRALAAAKAAGVSEDDAMVWSAQGSTFNERNFRATWRGIDAGRGVGPGTLFRMAREVGHRPGRRADRTRPVTPRLAPPSPAPERRTTLSDYGMDLWDQCTALSGVALGYLKTRRCVQPPADGDLRWHPSLKHPSGYVGPALVALITNVHTRVPLSLHRTWITPTGKADLDAPRLPLAGHSTKDGVIRLWPDETVTTGLGVAEGIETALSLAWAYQPVWACIDAGHLGKFPVLDGIESLVIARDRDTAGERACRACAGRWTVEGRDVFLTTQQANDLNDELVEAA